MPTPRARHARRLDVSPMAEAEPLSHAQLTHADADKECDIRGRRAYATGESTENLEVCQFACATSERPREDFAPSGFSDFTSVPRAPGEIALSSSPGSTNRINRDALGKHKRGRGRKTRGKLGISGATIGIPPGVHSENWRTSPSDIYYSFSDAAP